MLFMLFKVYIEVDTQKHSDYYFKDIYLVNMWICGYVVTKWILYVHGYVVTEYPHIVYPHILGVALKWQGIL